MTKNYKYGLKCTKRDVVLDCLYCVEIYSSHDYKPLDEFFYITKLEAINQLSRLLSRGYSKDLLHLSKIQTIKF